MSVANERRCRITLCTRNWKKLNPTARPKYQVTMEAEKANASQPAPVFSLFDKFCLKESSILRGPCASVDRVNIWSILYIIREISHHSSVRWAMKHSLHYWDQIIKFMQYTYFVSDKDGNTTRNTNIQKCLHLYNRCPAIASLIGLRNDTFFAFLIDPIEWINN